MELIEDYEVSSAYSFCDEKHEIVNKLIEEHGSDHDLINYRLNKKYPDNKYFVLVDYVDDRNMGYFHIRVWKKGE